MVPLAETEAERQRTHDSRPSREMRYASRDAWAARLVDAVDRLVTERLLLLAEDGDRLIAAARKIVGRVPGALAPPQKPRHSNALGSGRICTIGGGAKG
jgi:hypothetical protein